MIRDKFLLGGIFIFQLLHGLIILFFSKKNKKQKLKPIQKWIMKFCLYIEIFIFIAGIFLIIKNYSYTTLLIAPMFCLFWCIFFTLMKRSLFAAFIGACFISRELFIYLFQKCKSSLQKTILTILFSILTLVAICYFLFSIINFSIFFEQHVFSGDLLSVFIFILNPVFMFYELKYKVRKK